MGKILVVGSLHLDVIVTSPRLPGVDETLMGEQVNYLFGGKGGNQAVAAARMGGNSAMAGCVGDDQFASTILAALDEAGVNRDGVAQISGASGMSVAIVDANGDYSAVVVSAANQQIDPTQIHIDDDTNILVLQNEVPQWVNQEILKRAPENIRVVLNAAPARELSPEILARTDVLVVNRVEAHQMTAPYSSPEGSASIPIEDMLHQLASMGPRAVIITLGGEGLAGLDEQGVFKLPAFKVPVISTHGAGDMFTGALAANLAKAPKFGGNLRESCTIASAASALHVSSSVDERKGPLLDKVTEFLNGR